MLPIRVAEKMLMFEPNAATARVLKELPTSTKFRIEMLLPKLVRLKIDAEEPNRRNCRKERLPHEVQNASLGSELRLLIQRNHAA